MSKRKKEGAVERGILAGIRLWLSRNRLGELLVAQGLINPLQLREGLRRHRETLQPLGQVLVAQHVISRRQLAAVLRRQAAIRALAAGLFFFTSVAGGKKLRADVLGDSPASVTLASAPDMGQEFTRVSAYPALFGTAEKRSPNLQPFTKWTGLFPRLDAVPESWRGELESFRNLPLRSMAGRVNDFINKTRYVSDSRNWGRGDYWESPAEFARRGGDCEDFAIAKYAALRALGVPEERLRIAIVQDTLKNIPHALLIVYTNQGAYYLDNQTKQMGAAGGAGRYRPIFSINREAWWLHTAPGATVVASAR